MRIAILAPPWVPVPPPLYGGIEAMLDNLARGLRDAGHEVLLYATGDSTCDVPVHYCRATAAGTTDGTAVTELNHVVNAYETIVEWGADVVHDHTLVGPHLAPRFGLPVVTTNHGPFVSALGDCFRSLNGVASLVAISEHHASTSGDAEVSAVIHHGVDVDRFPVGDGEGGYALFLGRMSPDKGVHVAAGVARTAGVPLRIAAKMREPAERAYYETEVKPLLDADVQYIGEVGWDDKLELLAGASCLLNPLAWAEPFGMVMIEALACGTPVVATPWGSVPEIVEDGITGFVRATDEELVEALLSIDEIDRMWCRKVAAARFSTERMVADHLAVYRQVMADHTALRTSKMTASAPPTPQRAAGWGRVGG
jgi:glycosyltransferase involved in cell wall biosynthesis